MFLNLLEMEQLNFYILAAELFFLLLLQLRTNSLLKRRFKVHPQKKETVKRMKEEVKNGTSDIPVVKFERQKPKEEKKGYDPSEMAVLQEMMSEFFG